MQRSAAVKKTAEDLYGALGAACTEHENHRAHISHVPVCSNTRQVRFTLALSQLTLSAHGPGLDNKALWLTIESSFDDKHGSASGEGKGLAQIATTLKRTFVLFEDEKVDREGQAIKTKKALPPRSQCNSLGSTALVMSPPQTPTPSVVNLCTNGKICHYLARFINVALPGDHAIGYLRLEGNALLPCILKSLPCRPASDCGTEASVSLAVSRMMSCASLICRSKRVLSSLVIGWERHTDATLAITSKSRIDAVLRSLQTRAVSSEW